MVPPPPPPHVDPGDLSPRERHFTRVSPPVEALSLSQALPGAAGVNTKRVWNVLRWLLFYVLFC